MSSVKPAQSAARALAVINYLTVHPQMAFTLSELSSALNVSPASMSAVLLALSDSGYIVRHRRHRTFTLGPALVAAGHSASERHPVVEAARPELVRLATFGGECIGSVAVGDDIMILAIEGRASGKTRQAWIGQRIPLMPPFGQVFIAWAEDKDVEHWLHRLSPSSADKLWPELEPSLNEVRQRGLTIGLRNASVEAVIELVHQSANELDPRVYKELERIIPDQTINYALHQIEADTIYDVANLAAPVFGPDGTVVYAITLTDISGISGSDLERLCEEMRTSSRVVTKEIGGRVPTSMQGAPLAP